MEVLCDRGLFVFVDVTPPSVTCPNDQTLYHTEKKQCVDLLVIC